MGIGKQLADTVLSGASIIQNKRTQNRQQAYDMAMAKFQNSLAIQQWNRENEYNSPANQMALYKQAGINPRVAFANGGNFVSANAANTSNVPNTQFSPYIKPLDGVNSTFQEGIQVLNTIQGMRMNEAQLNVLNQQAKEIATRAKMNETRNTLFDIDIMYRHNKNYWGNVLLNAKAIDSLASNMFNFGNNVQLGGLDQGNQSPMSLGSLFSFDQGYRGQLLSNAIGQGSYLNTQNAYLAKQSANYLPYVGDVSKLVQIGANRLGSMLENLQTMGMKTLQKYLVKKMK